MGCSAARAAEKLDLCDATAGVLKLKFHVLNIEPFL
jgi:hypothetical protein